MDFGNYGIVGNTIYHFEKEPNWYWEFTPVTSGMELDRSKFMLYNRMVMDITGNRREQPPTWLEIAHREIALTFGGTNIPETELKKGATLQEVEVFLKTMPQPMIIELWKKIGEIYKDWGPVDPNAL